MRWPFIDVFFLYFVENLRMHYSQIYVSRAATMTCPRKKDKISFTPNSIKSSVIANPRNIRRAV
jgi:hypothetical protein